ncbi:hypothetical protein EON62_05970, partial [archaeon]
MLQANPPNMAPYLDRARAARVAAHELAARWRNREVSNFDYLMMLNRLAGRTFNDISQYPIFPWVLADYKSDSIDLADPRVYRDLAYPIAAQTPERRRALRSRYAQTQEVFDSMQEMCGPYTAGAANMSSELIFTGPPFHYGSFLLNPVTVAWYLMRMEPFSSYSIVFHDGKFDKPDREFTSVAKAFEGATTKDSDVKELVPEFYCSPEFLRNANGLMLGEKQRAMGAATSAPVDDVVLPPWAATPEEFVRIQRAALESEIVSSSLHLWVDLVFGHKQRGPHISGGSLCAVAACNVFHHLMYEGGLHLERIAERDKDLFHRIVTFIDNYGIMPPVMFPF